MRRQGYFSTPGRLPALMRLARCQRKQGRVEDAIATYAELSTLGETDVAGSPAELLARGERVRLFQATGDDESRAREAALLATILDTGRYAIDRATLDFYRKFLPAAPAGRPLSFARAEALQGAWTESEHMPEPALRRRAWAGRDSSLVTLWHRNPERTIVLVEGVEALVSEVRQTIGFLRIRFRLENADGRALWGGEEQFTGIQAAKSARETGLPFAVIVASSNPAAEQALLTGRRTLAVEADLRREGYEVEICGDGESAVIKGVAGTWDLILLDVMLPKKDGFEVCRDLRSNAIEAPILMLTAKTHEAEKVMGLELGADDYVTKPYSPRELRARVKALLRRSAGKTADAYRFGDNEIDFTRCELRRGGEVVALSALEFRLMAAFVRNSGRVLTRQRLLDLAWGQGVYVTERVVDNQVTNLRKKIEPEPERPRYIISLRGLGYRFDG